MSKLKIGVVGLGSIFGVHANAILKRSDCEITALCDTKPELLEKYTDLYAVKGYGGFEEMIDNESLDAVHICTPHYLHAPMTIYALKNKVNVLTEKPMAILYKDALEMVEEAKRNKVVLGVIFQNRFNRGSRFVKEMLSNGELGRVISARLTVAWNRSDSYYLESDWKGTWEKEGGGVVINQAIHTFDLVNWFINDKIKNIDANLLNRYHSAIEVEDIAEGVVDYEGGAKVFFYVMNYNTIDSPIEIILHCENGMANVLSDKAEITLNDGRVMTTEGTVDGEDIVGAKPYWGRSHEIQINDFYDSLKKGAQPQITGETVLDTQKMICGIYEKASNLH